MNQESNPKAADFLLIAGSSLIVLAVFVLVTTSWNSFSPLSRMLVSILPVILLYLIGFSYQSKKSLSKVSDYTVLAGSLLFPYVLSFVFKQSGFDSNTPALLNVIIALITLIWYIILEFVLNYSNHSLLTIIASVVTGANFLILIESSSWPVMLMLIILSYFYLTIAWNLESQPEKELSVVQYNFLGSFFAIIGFLFLPYEYFGKLSIPCTLVYALLGAISFVIAVIYGKNYLNTKSKNILFTRQVFENLSALILSPGLMVFNSDGSTLWAMICFILGLVSLWIAQQVRVKTFKLVGLVSVIVSIILLIARVFESVSANLILSLIIIGFVLIILSLTWKNLPFHKYVHKLWLTPDKPLFGLGFTYDEPKAIEAGLIKPIPMIARFLSWLIIIYVIIILISLFIGSLFT